jgi:hypothetical protein
MFVLLQALSTRRDKHVAIMLVGAVELALLLRCKFCGYLQAGVAKHHDFSQNVSQVC